MTYLITILRCFLLFKTVVTSPNIIVFKIKISRPKNGHPSHARSLVPRASSGPRPALKALWRGSVRSVLAGGRAGGRAQAWSRRGRTCTSGAGTDASIIWLVDGSVAGRKGDPCSQQKSLTPLGKLDTGRLRSSAKRGHSQV